MRFGFWRRIQERGNSFRHKGLHAKVDPFQEEKHPGRFAFSPGGAIDLNTLVIFSSDMFVVEDRITYGKERILKEVTQNQVLAEAYRCQDALVGYAYAILHDWHLAQDVFQETVIAANSRWQEFHSGVEMLPWLKQVVRHKAIDVIRNRKRVDYAADEQLIALMDTQFDRRFSDATGIETIGRRREAMQVCMGKLDSKPLGLLMGFYRDGKSCEVLATMCGRSVNAVRLAISRIRTLLRKCAAQELRRMERE